MVDHSVGTFKQLLRPDAGELRIERREKAGVEFVVLIDESGLAGPKKILLIVVRTLLDRFLLDLAEASAFQQALINVVAELVQERQFGHDSIFYLRIGLLLKGDSCRATNLSNRESKVGFCSSNVALTLVNGSKS